MCFLEFCHLQYIKMMMTVTTSSTSPPMMMPVTAGLSATHTYKLRRRREGKEGKGERGELEEGGREK